MRLLIAPLAALAACSSPAGPRSAESPSRPATVMPDCFLGDDRCALSLDLDGDGRADRVETVRDAACARPTGATDDGERPCLQGFWIALSSGGTHVVGAGVALDADPAAVADDEAIPLEPDLGFLALRSITTRRPASGLNWRQLAESPCAGDALVLSGGDAAFLLCWRAASPRAYHLGY